jgi:hypothetical protein
LAGAFFLLFDDFFLAAIDTSLNGYWFAAFEFWFAQASAPPTHSPPPPLNAAHHREKALYMSREKSHFASDFARRIRMMPP